MSTQWDKEDMVWISCPDCGAKFPVAGGTEMVHKHQLELQLEAHPEVSEEEDPLDKDVRERE